ncbi:Putative zinc- or iron-chelating domain protein [uncultured archaeon]|nr:Putative zinc- or iron-chelating domain protein [uncultured archaeon]
MVNCCFESNCIRCCIETNMILSYRDIENIQKMGYDRQFFVSERKGWLQLKNHQGRCVFHDGTRCTIYYQRPEGCTLYPVVYDKDNNVAILDNECPQKHCFSLSKAKSQQLDLLISILEIERAERMQSKINKNRKKL